METPAEIEFVGIAPPPDVHDEIDRHIAQLEKRFGRIIACRVAVRGPGEGHQNGKRIEVKIHLTLPGHKDVTVAQLPPDAQRNTDVRAALNDAFKRARRQLEDQVNRLEGAVKRHEEPPTGTIARLDPSGEFGFITTSDGREIYFHRNSVLNDGYDRLKPGTAVSYAEEEGDKGAQASTVRPTVRRTAANGAG
jgi:cold shock CspA family protein